MSKLLCTFAVMTVQPEQTPFTLADGWRWLGLMVNSHARTTHGVSSASPPFYVATALEVFLRVTAPHMHRAYGGAFMQLLHVVQLRVVPAVEESAPRRQSLVEFLTRFRESGGRDFMSLFQPRVA